MIKKSWLLLLESIKTQYLDIFQESKEFMSSVSYLRFSALLTRHLLLSAIKSKPGGYIKPSQINLKSGTHWHTIA